MTDSPLFQAFPFDPNPDWSRFYASGADILDYMKKTVKKWNLDRDLQLGTKVVDARWLEDEGQWKVTVETTRDGAPIQKNTPEKSLDRR